MTDDAGLPGVVDSGFPRLFGRLAELGVKPAGPPYVGPFWESYVTNPREEPDSSKWITEIVQPI